MKKPNQKKPLDVISPNTPESEAFGLDKLEIGHKAISNLSDFVTRMPSAKSPLESLIRSLCRDVNRQKITYHQLKYIFKTVRTRCEIEADTKRQKLHELPTVAELGRFYSAIESPVPRLIFEMLEGTGLRVSELCSLEVRRIDFAANMIFVSEGKGRKDRLIVVGSFLLEKLALFLEGRDNRYLFESNRRSKFTTRRIEQLCSRYKIKAQIDKPLTPHSFRHVWNTRLAESGVSRERRAILAGHSDQKTQDIYTHLAAGGFKSEIIEILDKLSRGDR